MSNITTYCTSLVCSHFSHIENTDLKIIERYLLKTYNQICDYLNSL